MKDSTSSSLSQNPLIWVLSLTVFLRLPSFAWPIISDDEAIYDAMAKAVNSGGVMYHEALDHKPPGLVYFYAFAERFLGIAKSAQFSIGLVHLFGIFISVLTALGLYLVAREILRKEFSFIPPMLYALVSTTQGAYDGLAVNGELLMNAPTIFAIYFVLRANHLKGAKRRGWDFLAGVLVGLAGLTKWQALVTGLAFPWLIQSGESADGLGRILKRGPFWLLGLLFPLGLVCIYFNSKGLLQEFFTWGGLFNLRYIAEGPGMYWALQRLGIQFLSVILPSLAFFSAAFYGLYRQIREPTFRSSAGMGFVIWVLVSFFSVAVGGRFFGHYFLQAELPLCFFATEPLIRVYRGAPKWISAALIIPAAGFFIL